MNHINSQWLDYILIVTATATHDTSCINHHDLCISYVLLKHVCLYLYYKVMHWLATPMKMLILLFFIMLVWILITSIWILDKVNECICSRFNLFERLLLSSRLWRDSAADYNDAHEVRPCWMCFCWSALHTGGLYGIIMSDSPPLPRVS